jgi:MFS family permease
MSTTVAGSETRAAVLTARISLSLLLAINLLNYIDRQVLSAVEDDVSKTFFPGQVENTGALTLGKMGFLSTAFIVSYMLAAPVFGWMSDRMSRWRLVGIGVLVWSFATAAGGFAESYTALLISRLFVGIGEAGYGPAAPSIISDAYPVQRRGTVLSWFYVAIPVGSALGYVIGELVAQRWGWRWAFYIVTIPGILLGIFCFWRTDPPRHLDDGEAETRKPKLADYLAILRIKSFLFNTLAMAAMTFAIGGIAWWMPRYLADERHLTGTPKTMFGAITVVAGLTATLLGGWVGDKLRIRIPGSYFFVSGVGILIACPFVLLMLWMPFPAAWVCVFLAVFFLFFNTGPSNTALANVVHPSVRASAFALNILAIHAIGDAPSPPLLGVIAGRFGWNSAFFVVVGFMAFAGILWLIATPYLAADTERASVGLAPA